jgi:hypothetical protein
MTGRVYSAAEFEMLDSAHKIYKFKAVEVTRILGMGSLALAENTVVTYKGAVLNNDSTFIHNFTVPDYVQAGKTYLIFISSPYGQPSRSNSVAEEGTAQYTRLISRLGKPL